LDDDGHAVHYSALAHGTPVLAVDGTLVGHVDEVLDNYRERILDGIVIRTESGERRFVDAPEVARTAERAVTLSIGPEEVAVLPLKPGGVGRLLPWRRRGR
jgi:hypothetical protein